jgi:small subunit ribosomal protein S9
MAGSGTFTVNGKELEAYFTRMGDVPAIIKAFEIADQAEKSYDVSVMVQGGGVTGQRDAVKLGLARALVKMDEELRPPLRHNGYLTRDPRVKERKKPGLKRARKAPTYTKR